LKYDEIALISLGISPSSNPDREQLEDALDEAVYEESNYFLKRDFLPKLAEKRTQKLKPLCKLSKQIGIETIIEENHESPDSLFKNKDLSEIIGVYNEEVSKFKLQITRTSSPCDVIIIYKNWKHVFISFSKAYCSTYEQTVQAVSQSQKKRISNIDFVELREELKSGNFDSKARELYTTLKVQI
jgi:hypothetical protein